METILRYKTIDGKEYTNKEEALVHENQYYAQENKRLNDEALKLHGNISGSLLDYKKNILQSIPETAGVYMLINPMDNHRKYIGSTNCFRTRFQYFLTESADYGGIKINEARKKTKPHLWQHVILETCDVLDLIERERYYVNVFNTVELGYNSVLPSKGGKTFETITTQRKNAEESWNTFQRSGHIFTKKYKGKKEQIEVNFNVTKDDYINKRMKYQTMFPDERLIFNFTLKALGKFDMDYVISIDDVVFIPQKLASLIIPRQKYQTSGLKSGVIFSPSRGKYKISIQHSHDEKWDDTEEEAYNEMLSSIRQSIINYVNDHKGNLDEEIFSLLNDITIKQIEQLVMIDNSSLLSNI